MHPVAKALAIQRLTKSVMDVKTRLYLTDDGEAIRPIMQEITRVVVITLLACKIDNRPEHTEFMDAALLKLCEMSENGFVWVKAHTFLIDDALDAVLLTTPKIHPLSLQQAVREVARMEAQEILNGA